MRRLVIATLVLCIAMAGSPPSIGAQEGAGGGAPGSPWTLLDDLPASRAPNAQAFINPRAFQALALDHAALRADLGRVPAEVTPGVAPPGGGATVSLPSPTGELVSFALVEAPIMEPALAEQFPDIRTFSGQGIDDPAATLKLDLSDQGLHAQVLSPDGAWYIDPYYHRDTSAYISYFRRDLTENPHGEFTEIVEDLGLVDGDAAAPVASRSGTQLRTHRAAVAATGEYTAFHGGTVNQGLAAIVTVINRVNGIYEKEVAIRLLLVANNNLLVYTNPATDPYAGNNNDINTNQTNIDAVIGNANYDIGHVFNTNSGLAGLGVVGVTGQKARGTTGLSTPVNDPFAVDFVAHEMGHQYGGSHTFNGSRNNCSGGNRNASTAYEPGSASTIQGYAGICGLDDLQLVGVGATGASDPYFHSISFDEIIAHTTGGNPGDLGASPTGNSVPTADAGPDGVIPASTPFLLRGAGTDANGDALTYNWEQRDLGAQRALDNPEMSAGPLFRSFVPSTSPVRFLPKLSTITAGTTNVPGPCPALTTTIGAAQACWSEVIPTVARAMNFRLTVRDNRAGGGGVNTDDMVVTVAATGAPFAVTSQSTAVSYAGNSAQTVTWNVAGTTAAPVSAPSVDILLSNDGGNTFTTTLATATPNDGSQSVTMPNITTTNARIMVVESGAGNGVRFFNVNQSNFSIGAVAATNDSFGSANTLGGPPATATGSNVGFTGQTGEPVPACASAAPLNTAWWNWTAPASGTVTIDTFGSTFDTVLAAYTGSAVNALTPVACNDDAAAGTQSQITFAATQGTTYRIQVDGFSGATGNITLNSSGNLCAGNNDFACAGTIAGPPATANGSNAGYTNQTGEPVPTCGPGVGTTAWWNWTAPSTGSVTIDTFGSSFDTVLAVYTGSAVNALTERACNDDYSPGLQSSVKFNATAGTTYRIQVGGFNGQSGSITLNTRPTPRVRAFGTVVNPEGDSGTSTANLVVLLESAPEVPYAAPRDVSFSWFTGDSPTNPRVAHPGEDFVAASGTAVIPAGATQVTVPIQIIGDTVDEPPLLFGEWGLFAANNPSDNAIIDTTTFFGIGLFIIIDDDP